MYHPAKYSFARLTYMPFTYDSDEKRYFNSIILDGQYTHMFNDNLALIVRPQLITEKLLFLN